MSTRYQLYVANTIKLVESLIIKSTDSIDTINQWVIDYYGIDSLNKNDPHTWKYYLNISGEYHFADIVMEVVSWDTLETIVFNKENLAIHRATFKAYEYGTIQYMNLINKYPNQELLINGILNPVNIDTAINADNGIVLAYNTTLIEENEYSLLNNINTWITSFKSRYVNEQFSISDELYAATHHGIMYLHLVPAIMNFRLAACKTNEAHSYHITEYLLSHGVPEYSIMHMTKKQMLFFYRNIKYIQRNAASKDTFTWILDHIMTERFLPMSEYVMKHNWEHQLDNLLPEVTFRNKHLNDIYGATDQDNLSTLDLLVKEDGLALGNPVAREEDSVSIDRKLSYSRSSTVMTKVLESAIIDYTESGQNRPEEVLLNHWLYFAMLGKYKAYIGIINPKTEERIPMNAKDAFILMTYAWAKSMGIDLVTIPTVLAKRVLRIPTLTPAKLMELADSKYVSIETASKLISFVPIVGDIISTEAFNNVGNTIFQCLMNQLKIPDLEEHFYSRGLVHNMVHGLYCDVVCELAPEGTLYGDWFAERTLDFSSFTRIEFSDLYSQIVEDMTGIAMEKEPNLKSLQTAMIKLFEYLSSYSIQFVKKINNNGLINLRTPAVTCGDITGTSGVLMEFYDSAIDFIDLDIANKFKTTSEVFADDFSSGSSNLHEVISMQDRVAISLDFGVDIAFKPNIIHQNRDIDLGNLNIDNVTVTPL